MKASKWISDAFKDSRPSRWLCWGSLLFCSIYAYLVYVFSIAGNRPPILMFPIYYFIFPLGVAWLWRKLQSVNLKDDKTFSELKPLHIVLCITAFYWLIILVFGTVISYDTERQWEQILANRFHDWHPIIHTLSIWLFAQIFESITFVIMMQSLIFALLCLWLYKTLKQYHYKKWVVYGVMAFVCFSPINLVYFRTLLKDVAFALASFSLVIMLIHLWNTKGEWLLKPWRMIAFLIVIILSSFYRHNGIFLTLPFCFFLPLLYEGWKKKLQALGIAFLAYCCIGGYIIMRQELLKKDIITTASHQNFTEAIGLPLSMMGEAFVMHPEQVPAETKELLLKMGSEEEWRLQWRGDFNSVKFYFGSMKDIDGRENLSSILEKLGSKKFFELFLKTCISAPTSAIKAFLHVTSLAWAPLENRRLEDMLPRTAKLMNNEINFPLRVCFHFQPFNWIIAAPGMQLLLIILFGGFAFIEYGWKACILSVPFMCYTLGTGLLLTGYDHRFFFVLSLCVAPILCLCLTRPQE